MQSCSTLSSACCRDEITRNARAIVHQLLHVAAAIAAPMMTTQIEAR